ncbi:HNH endonuclease [Arthrobacter sp. Sa2CUA1]|uniref:HNH endonuclease n=2 Tax=Arthrobacter gallicola TaxID=2762225 RepID=A0ABR8UP27_9MICC|nr:HNH endonuclease [Arthrobacter gallicola]
MADTLVERITGQATASQVPVEVQLVITDRTLFTTASQHEAADTDLFQAGAARDVPPNSSSWNPSGGGCDRGRSLCHDNGDGHRDGNTQCHESGGSQDGNHGSGGNAQWHGSGGDGHRDENVQCHESGGSLDSNQDGNRDSGGNVQWHGYPTEPSRDRDRNQNRNTEWAGNREPAYFPGYGIVPGQWARDLITDALLGQESAPIADNQSRDDGIHPVRHNPLGPSRQSTHEPSHVTLRRLFLDPTNGELMAMDSKARYFTPGLARLIRTRDQTCRTPWCDAPIRHIDHIHPYAEAGPTSYTNGQGLCEACNQAKEAPGWTAETTQIPGQRHTVRTVTPTGHTYHSTAPAQPGTAHAQPGAEPSRPGAVPAARDRACPGGAAPS